MMLDPKYNFFQNYANVGFEQREWGKFGGSD